MLLLDESLRDFVESNENRISGNKERLEKMGVRRITNRGQSKKVIGKFPSYKLQRTIYWESKLERDYLYLLEFDPDVISYEEQPFRIIYSLDGNQRRYTPDFLVLRGNEKQIIEIKPSDKASTDFNRRRFRVIASVCRQKGFKFKLLTEKEIRK